ncbi:MAG: hypothetical protein KC776_35380 [Myxococcales bacterium]|nr:hypothetical protein [Myxococcales bacterium]
MLWAQGARADEALTTATWSPSESSVPPASEAPPDKPRDAELDPAQRALAIAAAAGPGVVVHGLGHSAAGKPKTAQRLLAAEGVGLGLIAASGVGLALTGASRYVVAPLALTGIAGFAVFGTSWLADVHGVATDREGASKPLDAVPVVVSEAGYRYVYDPQFRYRSFLVEGADLRFGRLRVSPSGWFALDDDNARLRLETAWRLSGPTPHRPTPGSASFVDLEAAVTHHRYDSDGFRRATAEVSALGRWDLRNFDPALAGSFAEVGAGFALSRVSYRIDGMQLDPELEDLLLARFGFGFWLGDPTRRGSEVRLYYDHRHDDYAAGLIVTGLASGVAGHFGVDARTFFDERWGMRLDAQVGAAWIAGLSLLYRVGSSP